MLDAVKGITYTNLPQLSEEPKPIDWKRTTILRKVHAHRAGFTGMESVREVLMVMPEHGYRPLGRAEFRFMTEEMPFEAEDIPRCLLAIIRRRPMQLPFLLFPADDIGNEMVPAVALCANPDPLWVSPDLTLPELRILIPAIRL